MNGEEQVGNNGYCYIFLPTKGDDVLYVGATKDISCRLYQHFVCGGNDYNQDKYNEVACVIFCEANTTEEAFLIEAVLIDLLRPKWNVMDPCKKKDLQLGYISSLPWHFIHSKNLRNANGDYARNEIIKSVDHALTGLNKFAADEFFEYQQERLQKNQEQTENATKTSGKKIPVKTVKRSEYGFFYYEDEGEPSILEILEKKAEKLEQEAQQIRYAIGLLREVIK